MGGRRCKALRKAFIRRTGRSPQKSSWSRWGILETSEWRRVKKGWKRHARG